MIQKYQVPLLLSHFWYIRSDQTGLLYSPHYSIENINKIMTKLAEIHFSVILTKVEVITEVLRYLPSWDHYTNNIQL